MRAEAPEGIGEAALREFWLLKLPTNVRTVVASLDHPLETLAVRADRVMEAYASQALDQINHEDDRIESLQREITLLSRQVQALVAAASSQRRDRTPASPPQQRSPKPLRRTTPLPRQDHDVCFYHQRYGLTARQCRKLCAFFANLGIAADPTPKAKPPAEN